MFSSICAKMGIPFGRNCSYEFIKCFFSTRVTRDYAWAPSKSSKKSGYRMEESGEAL